MDDDPGGVKSAMQPGAWLRSEDPAGLAQRMTRLIAVLDSSVGAACDACERAVCGHDVVLCVAAGYESEPLCGSCLAAAVGRDLAALRATTLPFVRSKECLRRAWALADAMPHCGTDCGTARTDDGVRTAGRATAQLLASAEEPPREDAAWDAGDMGCGDLVLELRLRLRDVAPGTVLRVTASDPGAPEDLPAWCRITGNALVAQQHPDYWIRRKD